MPCGWRHGWVRVVRGGTVMTKWLILALLLSACGVPFVPLI